jgi:hypothetical protein
VCRRAWVCVCAGVQVRSQGLPLHAELRHAVCCVALLLLLQIALPLLSAIPVADVARAMILDAEAFRLGGAAAGGAGGVATFGDAAMRRAAAAGEPPQE